ncbi:MAG: hypothetical protein ACE15B_03300 [Bryobacteraceae bacterium]
MKPAFQFGTKRAIITFVRVFCHSGHAAEERPVRFEIDGVTYGVIEVTAQWRTPEDDFFKVRASDGKLYVLRRNRAADVWTPGGVRP